MVLLRLAQWILSWVFSVGNGDGSGSGESYGNSEKVNVSLSATERNKMLRDLKLDSAGPDLSNFDYPKDYDMLCMISACKTFI